MSKRYKKFIPTPKIAGASPQMNPSAKFGLERHGQKSMVWGFIFSGLLVLVVFFNYLFVPYSSRASTELELQNQLYKAGNKAWGSVPGPTGLADLVQYVVSAFLGLLGIIFLVLIIYAGFNWMTAQGDEEKVTLAKNTLSRAVIGLVIILAAYSITYFVFSSLSKTGGNPLGGSGV